MSAVLKSDDSASYAEVIQFPVPQPEYRWWRMGFHVSTIGFVAWLSLVVTDLWHQAYIIGFFMVFIFPVVLLQNRYEIFQWSMKLFQCRSYEFNGRMSPVDFVLGVSAAYAILITAPREVFACVLLICALCDPPGRAVGIFCQRRGWAWHWPSWLSQKTMQGSFAVWLTAWLTACLVLPWEKAVIVAIFAAVAEVLPQPVFCKDSGEAPPGVWLPVIAKIKGPFDNGLIPLASAVGFLLVA